MPPKERLARSNRGPEPALIRKVAGHSASWPLPALGRRVRPFCIGIEDSAADVS